jgi:charged multivesicular body protein 4
VKLSFSSLYRIFKFLAKMNLFGKKKAAAPANNGYSAPTPPPVETIKLLRDNLLVLEKREEHIVKKIEAALQEAKAKSLKKDKNGALFALKRKKMYETEVTKLQGARITLDSQILSLESAAVNLETFKAMKAGAGAMKNMRGNIDADKVEDMMDEIQEERDIHDQISDAISRPGQDLFNDEDLLAELAELDAMEEEVMQEAATAPVSSTPQTVFSLPSVPTANIGRQAAQQQQQESEDERALRELQASMLA